MKQIRILIFVWCLLGGAHVYSVPGWSAIGLTEGMRAWQADVMGDKGIRFLVDIFENLAGIGYAGILEGVLEPRITGGSFVSAVNVPGFTMISVRTDRTMVSAATGGQVCAKTHTIATEAHLDVIFPTSFSVNTTAANWTTNTTSLPNGSAAWPGIGTATAVSGNTVTFPSGDLTPDTLYCFNFVGTDTLTAGIAGTNQIASLRTSDNGKFTINFSQYALAVIADDQVTVSAEIPSMFAVSLSGAADTFTSPLSSDTVTFTHGRTFLIINNANSGWVAWVKSSNTALVSASTGKFIPTTGVIDDVPSDLSNTTGYLLDVAITFDANNGVGGVSQGVGYGAEYAGTNTSSGGTLSTTFQPIASAGGTTGGDILTLKERARITPLQPAATDYTDTLTIVAAGKY